MKQIIFTDSYKEKETRFLKKHPELLNIYGKVLRLIEKDAIVPVDIGSQDEVY